MAKKTLLDVVQGVLSLLDSDEVNSIADTIEGTQIAYLVRECYEDIVEEMDLGHKGELIYLESATDATHPTLMKIPDSVGLVEWINYTKPADA